MESKKNEMDLSEEVCEKLRNKLMIKEQIFHEKPLQELFGYSDDLLERMYRAAYQLFQASKHLEASNAFLFLATINPYHFEYWLGFGAATQKLGDHEAAIDAYEMAAICKLDNPIAYFHLAQCLFAIHDRKSALQALELAIEYSEDNPEHEELHRQALAAKKTLLIEE